MLVKKYTDSTLALFFKKKKYGKKTVYRYVVCYILNT